MDLRAKGYQIGIREEFWDLDFEEYSLIFKGYNNQKEEELRTLATMVYTMADLVGYSVNRFINAGKMPKIYEVFPTLFEDTSEEERTKQAVARIKSFAIQWNTNFGGKNNE